MQTDGRPQDAYQDQWHATTIVLVRKGGRTVIGGDGQVSLGQTIIKGNARKVRRLGKGGVIAGFAGATADAFALFERLEAKLEQYPSQLLRACVELAKEWRTDRYLRRLEAMMLVADPEAALVLTGTGDVLEPETTSEGSAMPLSIQRVLNPRFPRCPQRDSRRGKRFQRRKRLRADGDRVVMKAQMRYADRRGAPCVVIQGSDERTRGEVQIKDLVEGARAAASIASNEEWKAARPAQISVPEERLVESVREILARHQLSRP